MASVALLRSAFAMALLLMLLLYVICEMAVRKVPSCGGGKGGNLTEFNLQASEYITSVKGHISTFNGVFVLRSLTFETNLGSYGPYGQEEGIPFELPAITGQIIGFHARSGVYLDALGVYVKANNTTGGDGSTNTGKPGTWTQGDGSNFWDRPVSGA